MKILLLHNLGQSFGGGGYSIFKFFEALSERGHHVHLLYSNNNVLKSRSGNLKIHRRLGLDKRNNGHWIINRLLGEIQDFFVLRSLIKKNTFDYICGFQKSSAIKASKYGKLYNIKIANFIFETPPWLEQKWPEWKMHWKKNPSLRKQWESFRNALKISDIIIANSEITSDELHKWLGLESSGVVYPGFNSEYSQSSQAKGNQIAYLGRLETNKNVDDLIRAFSKIKTNTRLVICGDGSMFEELNRLAKELDANVLFKGLVTEEEKWAELTRSKFLVFPSSFEGFGMPPMEALSVGTYCLCSDIPILQEVYKDYIEYFPEHDIDKLAEKIQFLIDNPDYCEQKAKVGQKYIMKSFGWNKSAKNLEDILLKNLRNLMMKTNQGEGF